MRLRSQVLPTVAMEGACRRRVTLSFIRPSPVTFTVKGLPVGDGYLRDPSPPGGPSTSPDQNPLPHHVSPSPTWDMFVSKLDVDDVVARLGGAVGDLAGAILHVLTVNVHLAGALNGQAQPAVTWVAMGTCSEVSHGGCPCPGHGHTKATSPNWPWSPPNRSHHPHPGHGHAMVTTASPSHWHHGHSHHSILAMVIPWP